MTVIQELKTRGFKGESRKKSLIFTKFVAFSKFSGQKSFINE